LGWWTGTGREVRDKESLDIKHIQEQEQEEEEEENGTVYRRSRTRAHDHGDT